ncbi:ankyrin repeat domain-containing protein [Endozoicomonas sp. YOMI1]|uniref:ankyrin repeat domain-containing protein n=1 Tax=Endozoicomonas sp. YOMI1 TaxID=2828739 RepID=UPI0021478EE3|nr:ankyrin repeat domain-containing protein [Endozoicomonas sp. YOMI1]
MNNSYRELCSFIAPKLQAMVFEPDSNPENNNAGGARALPNVMPDIDPHVLHLTRSLCVHLECREVVNLKQIQAYLTQGADLNTQVTIGNLRDCNPLHSAAISGNGAAVAAIIASGQLKDINSVDGHGFTPLALLCGARVKKANFNCRFTSVLEERNARRVGLEALLGANADQHITDHNSYKPVHHAARHNFPGLIKRLVEHYLATDIGGAARPGDLINCPDRLGNTPLHIAARYNQLGSTKALLELEANASALNTAEQTPLHRLCMSQYNNNACGGHIVCLLLQHGVDADLKDKKGFTWSKYAGTNGMDQLLRYVRNHSNLALADHENKATAVSAARSNVNTGRKSGIPLSQAKQVFKCLKSEPSTLLQSCKVVIRDILEQEHNQPHVTDCMKKAVAKLDLPHELKSELLDGYSFFE